MHHYKIGDLLEDLVFRDLGALSSYGSFGFYGATLLTVFETLALSHFFSHHDHGVLRDAKVGAVTMIIEQGLNPLVWPSFDSSVIHDPHLQIFVFTASATFGAFIFYGMVMWRAELDKAQRKASFKRFAGKKQK